MTEEEIKENALVEYDPYQKLYIATYKDFRGEGKSKEDAMYYLLIDVYYTEDTGE